MNKEAQELINACNNQCQDGEYEPSDGIYAEKEIINSQKVVMMGVAGTLLVVPIEDL